MREGLLSLLRAGPTYGFDLKSRFEEATGHVWPLNVGQVYTTLDRLERDGAVTVTEDDGQKTYRLTADGEHELSAWWETSPLEQPPPRDELLLKILLALPHGRDHALDVLTRQRSAVVARLRGDRRHDGRDGAADHVAGGLVRDAVLLRAEADLRWLDRCEARILESTEPTTTDARDRRGPLTGRARR